MRIRVSEKVAKVFLREGMLIEIPMQTSKAGWFNKHLVKHLKRLEATATPSCCKLYGCMNTLITHLAVVLYNFMGLQRRACAIISEADVIWTL